MGVVVVDGEELIVCVAVGRRGFGLPLEGELALARGVAGNEIYLLWLCVPEIKGLSSVHDMYVGG